MGEVSHRRVNSFGRCAAGLSESYREVAEGGMDNDSPHLFGTGNQRSESLYCNRIGRSLAHLEEAVEQWTARIRATMEMAQ